MEIDVVCEERGNEEVGVVVAVLQSIDGLGVFVFCGGGDELLRQQLALVQKLVLATLVDQHVQFRTAVST